MAGQHQHEWNIEAFRSMAETGKAAQTALLTVAGGSSAAVLSFVGVLMGKHDEIVTNLMFSLRWFAGSLIATVLMSGLAYLAQAFYKRAAFSWSDARDDRGAVTDQAIDRMGDRQNRRGDIVSGFVTGLFILALVLLIIGCIAALSVGPAPGAVIATRP